MSIDGVMAHDLPDIHLEPSSFENINSFSFHGVPVPPQLAYTTSPTRYTHLYTERAERSDLFPSQHYHPDGQYRWNLNGSYTGAAAMAAPNQSECLTAPVYGSASPYGHGQGNPSMFSSMNLNHLFPNSHSVEYLSPPAEDISYERFSEKNVTELLTPQTMCDEPNHW